VSVGVRREWQRAELVAAWPQTDSARSLRFRVPGWAPQLPGQHCLVRLTAPDGYTAQRSYSIASTASTPELIEVVIERLADGEVSPHLHDVLAPGDAVEVRGPFGGHFIWSGGSPVALIGGGSGVAPLMAMLRCWRERDRPVPLRMVVSVRAPEQLWFAGEYGAETTVVYTRQAPPGWPRPPGRLDAPAISAALAGLPPETTAYVCGSHGFAEHASRLLVQTGWVPADIRIERFGPS
jgi:ferredoxin-NADP reductase